jgi:hypothetical protein
MKLDIFKQIIELIQTQDKVNRKLDASLSEINSSWTITEPDENMRQALYLALEEIFDDRQLEVIDFYLDDVISMFNDDGTLYKRLETIEDLYNYLEEIKK